MRNKFLSIVILLMASAHFISVHAQDPPPPAKDYSPSTWEEYSFPAAKFRIRFPQKPTESTATQGGYEVRSVGHKGLLNYLVAYVDFQVPIDEPQKVKEMLQSLKTAALNAIKDKEVKMVAEREVVVDGHRGIFIHVEVAAKEVIRMQWVAAGSRLYTISTSNRKGIPQEAEGADDFEKIAGGFISSFHVTPD